MNSVMRNSILIAVRGGMKVPEICNRLGFETHEVEKVINPKNTVGTITKAVVSIKKMEPVTDRKKIQLAAGKKAAETRRKNLLAKQPVSNEDILSILNEGFAKIEQAIAMLVKRG